MAHSIKTVYVVHHSHTDIGYTDLQERVIAIQVNYIKTVLSMMRQPEYADFRWNCETLYCVEEFWKQASEDDRADFARFVKEGKIGISANYLNFNDLVNADVWCCTIKVDIENSKGQYIEKDKQEATKDGSESTKIQHGI